MPLEGAESAGGASAAAASGAVPAEGQALLERLEHWCRVQPDKRCFTFLDDHGREVDSLTYKQTRDRAVAIAQGLLSLTADKKGSSLWRRSGSSSPSSSKAKAKAAAATAPLLRQGDRVLLVFLPSLDFIVAFLGCLHAGLVPVPVFPPDPRRLRKDLYMFASIQASSGATVALTHKAYNHLKKARPPAGVNVADIARLFKAAPTSSSPSPAWPEALAWVLIETFPQHPSPTPSHFLPPPAPAASPCFLQYTSGSTSAPKGVVVTHGNLAHNLSIIAEELQTGPGTVEVSWLPQYHDMGLIGSYLGLLYCGGTGYYASPLSFIRNPLLWLHMLSTHRGTHTQAPNFAFALAAKKYVAAPEPKPAFDLSSVRHMINAAEPVDGPSLDAFAAAFRPLGLKCPAPSPSVGEGKEEEDGVVFPTYGLAEHTVFVCGGGKQRLWVDKAALEGPQQRAVPVPPGAPGAREVIGCGVPRHGVALAIVNPETHEPLGEGEVGEIWVDSPSKAQGYFNHPQETQEAFEARLLSTPAPTAEAAAATAGAAEGSSSSQRTYLRTGDLGFLHKGELFVCGRIKDLIIVRGRNHYPQDVERTAERAAPELRPGCSAAFPVFVPNGGGDTTTSTTTTNNNDNGSTGRQGQQGQSEGVALVAEVREVLAGKGAAQAYRALAERIFQTLSREDGVVLQHIWLLKPRTVPKTTSGKIARKWCQKAFHEGTLETLYAWSSNSTDADAADATAHGEGGSPSPPPPLPALETAAGGGGEWGDAALPPLGEGELAGMPMEELTRRVKALARRVMGGAGGERVWGSAEEHERTVHCPLMALGMDSMASAQLKGALEAYFGTTLPDDLFFQEITSIKRLAVMLYALGHGHLTPQDALEQYEANHGQTYVFELEAGGRAPAGADRHFERAIQTCPCLLCLPCFR